MSTEQLLQLYAPFVGLVALAFWVGSLGQRVKQLEKTCDQSTTHDKVIKLEAEMVASNKTLESVDRQLQGIHRQLANIAMGRVGAIAEIPGKDPLL